MLSVRSLMWFLKPLKGADMLYKRLGDPQQLPGTNILHMNCKTELEVQTDFELDRFPESSQEV